MVDLVTIIELVDYIKSNDSENFKLNIKSLPYDVIDFTDMLTNKEKETAIQWCRESKIYLLHKIFSKATRVESVAFVKENVAYYKQYHTRDDEEKTWLHIAVQNNRSNQILRYLVEDLEVDVDKTDVNKYTALHFACLKQEYVEGELDILIKFPQQLIARSYDDVTPLELACSDKNKLKDIKMKKNINLNELLDQIDKITSGLLATEDYYFNDKLTTEKYWLSLFQKNNKYRLIYYIKKDENFSKKYYLNSAEMLYVINNCHENGQGVLTYIKRKYFKHNLSMTLEKLFTELTGLSIKEASEKEAKEVKKEVESKYKFYKSSLFLALITGRFDLIPCLLMTCQFDIVSYGLFVSLICNNLLKVSEFPDQVLENIKKTKDFCEKYSMAVVNRVVIRDLTPEKRIISGFLNKPNILSGQRILDIAYLGKCSKFLSLPSCQKALTKLWHRKSKSCPSRTFYIHSFVHCIFLALFSYFLVNDFYSKISVIEIICYVYGVGYFFEETRQIYVYQQKDFLKSYFNDPTNYMDISALFFMLLGFILRFCLRNLVFPGQNEREMFVESSNVSLFVIRLVLCLSFISFFMRIIYFGSIFEQLGPKLKMMSIMIVRDLMPLIFIFIVFITSFGITFQALLYPNSFYALNYSQSYEKRPALVVISDIFKRSTYTIFHTHYALEEMEHREFPYFVHNEGNIAVFFLLVVYMIVVNIMLINLLIALFSNTVTNIIQVSSESWKASRYKDIKEYYDKSMLPPPLNIFEIIVVILILQCKKTKVLVVRDEEDCNLLKSDLNENKDGPSMSFRIIQAFALKDYRYKLISIKEDEEYERKTEIKYMKKAIEKLEKSLKDQGIKI